MKVNRIEVIDHSKNAKEQGRVFTKWEENNFEVRLSIQDDDRTLKVFISDIPVGAINN